MEDGRKIQIFFLVYQFKYDSRRMIQHIDDATLFKTVFLNQMLHDFIVFMCIHAQVRDLCQAVIDNL